MCLPTSIYMTNVTNHTIIVTKIWLHLPPMKMFEKMFGSNLLPIKDMVDLNNVVQFLLFGQLVLNHSLGTRIVQNFETKLTHSQLLERLKCESKQKTAEEGGVGARFLAHNTLRGRGVCWSSKMGLRRVDKLHSLTRAYTQPTQSGQCIVGTPLVLG